jgi:hypothetical protein
MRPSSNSRRNLDDGCIDETTYFKIRPLFRYSHSIVAGGFELTS